MIIDDTTLISLCDVLVSEPFSLHPNSMSKVWRILKDGNVQHPERRHTAIQHLEAALRHAGATGNDEDSGLPHAAHTVSRLLLALLAICRKGDR